MLLKAIDVSFSYHKKNVLEHVNLVIESGEVVGLFGPSGVGKSTLSKILAGYMLPHAGSATIDHRKVFDIKGYHPVQLIYQHPEKVVNPRWKMLKIMKEAYEPSKQLMEDIGIKDSWLERLPGELSGGELQRFCVLRALHENTKFLIADEMTSMLDPVTQVQIWDVVLTVARERNMGLLVISHDKDLLERVCDRVICL